MMMNLLGCKTNTSVDFCFLYKPVLIDPEKDTIETQKQILKYNLIFEKYCEQDEIH